jgi:3'(2'), 5'-bisphosphate nucleotidase
MNSIILTELLEVAKQAALTAGAEIIKVYNNAQIEQELKADQSPLTLADKNAQAVIAKALSQTQIPLLSEEGQQIEFAQRQQWDTFWLVDPLDGTKEFINRNGEFTVNIALIRDGEPVLGVVYVPVQQSLFWGAEGIGSFMQIGSEPAVQLRVNQFDQHSKGLSVVGSKSHMNPETEQFIAKFSDAQVVNMGSSLKFLIIAQGKADIYPRFGPTMEWDTAAAHAVLKYAGGKVLSLETGLQLVYNKPDLHNPFFVAIGDGQLDL